ncbi:PDGLE domain-containing protein [Mycobacterium sp. NPDC050551]|uniref:PDGLE domain-containing protein n=1 Tax=Mycobacterium sp. NPDC050551 TaxID=3155407 RepID=UPI00341C1B55
MTRRPVFWFVFAAAVLVIAGGLSYFASGSPDGLDSATLQGCDVVQTAEGEELSGACIAQHATEHPLASSPLADYAIGGHSATGGIAGIVGALVTLAVAGVAFWGIARSKR